jgi:hypothetical protein
MRLSGGNFPLFLRLLVERALADGYLPYLPSQYTGSKHLLTSGKHFLPLLIYH